MVSDALRVAHGAFGRLALLRMDAALVRHAHPHCHVLIKLSGADAAFRVDDQLAPLTAESAVLVNAWQPHAYVHAPGAPSCLVLALYISPDWLARFSPGWLASAAPRFFASACVALPRPIRALADTLAQALHDAPAEDAATDALLTELMIAVAQRFAASSGLRRQIGPLAGVADYRVRRAVALIREDPAGIHDMAGLARQSGLSRAHFFRLFGEATQLTPRVFLNTLRVERAMAAVMGSDASFTDIGADLGFSAPPHFTRFFRDHAGTAPSAFRAAARTAPRVSC